MREAVLPGQVDDAVGSLFGKRAHIEAGVEHIGGNDAGAGVDVGARSGSNGRDDLVAAFEEGTHDVPTDVAACPRDQDPILHGVSRFSPNNPMTAPMGDSHSILEGARLYLLGSPAVSVATTSRPPMKEHMILPDSPSSFPEAGKRIVFYLHYEPRGHVDAYVPYKLERLRPFVDRLVIVSNGPLTEIGRAMLSAVSDEIWERENDGFDVGGYQWALDRVGSGLEEFDELILMNYTWFGPIGSFDPLFERMDAAEVDYWGITDHGAITPHPITDEGTMPSHIQSHWIAVRPRLFLSDAWKQYWAEMPHIDSYSESILNHESRFTSHFEALGFNYLVAYPHQNYPGTAHPAFERAQKLMDDGCPVLKRRAFFHDPLYLDREGIIGRWLLSTAEAKGYPASLILENMAKSAKPKVLNTNASMLEILPEVSVSYDSTKPFRIAAVVHIFYEDLTDELLDRLDTLPSAYDLFVTTTDEEKAAYIRERIAARTEGKAARSEVRVLPSNRGRDLSAFFIGARDVVTGGEYDLVVKIHSKKTVQQGEAVGALFKRQQLDNLLNSAGYASNVLGLFQREERLGVVFPPTVHIGFPTLGGAWFTNKEPTQRLADELGIRVPLDDISPLAPMGAMWIARPEAMRLLFEREYSYDEYSPEGDHSDGSLAHVQERIIPLAAAELGYHSRTVANAEYAAISHTFLEYKLDQMSETVQDYAINEVARLHERNAQVLQLGSWSGYQRQYLRRFHPKLLAALRPGFRLARRVIRGRRADPPAPLG